MATREGELFVEKVEVSLDGRQIFCLFCGGAVIASLVFVLGVAVGRRVEAREHPGAAQTSGATTDPLAALDRIAADGAAAGPELAFASTLRGDGTASLGAVDQTIADAAEEKAGELASAGKAPVVVEEEPVAMLPARPLIEAEDPAVKVAKAQQLKAEQARLAAAKAEQSKAEQLKADAAEAEQLKAERLKADAARAEQARVAAAKPEPAKQAPTPEPGAQAAAPTAAPAASPEGPRFTLHLLSFQDRGEADALVGRLRKAGYQPFVVEGSDPDKGTMFRVRVGQFSSFDEAVTGKSDFEKKQNIIAYVTRTKK